MNIEEEIRKTIARAVELKGGHQIPTLAMLVGAPLSARSRFREDLLVDMLLGMSVGAAIDRGDTDAKILADVTKLLEDIRRWVSSSEEGAKVEA